MPEMPKEKNEKEKKIIEAERETNEKNQGALSKDQREKSYYYDDDYGYEIYNPDEEDDDDEED
jgi:predicted Zn-dependent peptidase